MNEDFENLRRDSVLVDRLESFVIIEPLMEELVALEKICSRNPAIGVILTMKDRPHEIVNFPAILRALKWLDVTFALRGGLDELNTICERLPDVTSITLELVSGLRKLMSCDHILARLSTLDLIVSLSSGEDVVLFKELCELCPRLTRYRIVVSFNVLESFLGFADAPVLTRGCWGHFLMRKAC